MQAERMMAIATSDRSGRAMRKEVKDLTGKHIGHFVFSFVGDTSDVGR
jgi:hypothetical protein